MNECLFCKIAEKKLSAKIVLENKVVLAFNDIAPKAPVHILIIPKNHISSIASDNSENIARELIKTAKEIAKQENLNSYKLVFNVGKKAGQTIDHLHLHLLSAKNNETIPEQLNV